MDVESNSNGIKIISLPMEKGPIFSNLKNKLKAVVDMQTFVNIFKSVITGRNLFYIMNGFLHNLAKVEPEDTKIYSQI